MNISLRIAWRYLFAKKSHNAINIVSGVSAAGVCVVTAALVCVLSVMNGFGSLVEQMFSAFDADIRITPVSGKHFRTDTESFESVKSLPEIAVYSETVEETALVCFSQKQLPALLKGVDDNFQALTAIDSIITDGTFSVCDYYDNGTNMVRAFERCVVGRGLASQLGISAHFVSGIKLYAPKHTGTVNLMRPDKSFNQAGTFIAGIFTINQAKYDDRYMIVSLPLARSLFEYNENEVTAVELRLQEGISASKVKKQLRQLIGDSFRIEDRYEQQADFFRIMKIEKALTALLLVFILLIASFNIIGSLSMLMIDKKEDIRILSNLGASHRQIQRIFLYEGWLISLLGAFAGLVIGLIICLLQEEFGLLKLGSGTDYIISAYPVEVQATDMLLVAVIVLLIGFAAAWYPSRQLKTTNLHQP
ncbi:MAG: FtsX-like permease family protein [Paludibacter sp.]|nr:FtsX-like permease family protein [Bacteroidales bacterium]MCM1068408.1 FtsX-like permease family protein [Prevotella sp.]MCM1353363.1 FtsX-like permease family protein [Bacteroides sp.]MCM1442524.1 FtsX-like permease family protein [Muribaculum sp.]MCM1481369.1 FtsX-like permease family protein [Paludibacter sp.]